MSTTLRRAPWLILAIATVTASVVVVTVAAGNQVARALPYLAVALALVTVGAVVAARYPRNAVGWVFCVSGLICTVGYNLDSYARWALFENEPPATGGTFAAWFSNWSWVAMIGAPVLVSLFLGADGRLLSPGWRLPFVAAWVGLLLLVTGAMVAPELELAGDELVVPNPWAVPQLEWVFAIGAVVVVSCALAGAVSLVLRLRRSRGLERQQLKCVASAFAFAAFAAAVGGALWSFADWAFVVTVLGLAAIPAGVGIAILRYRLYEIDVIIRRTLVYGVVTAGLAGLYFATVLLLQQVFSSFAGGSDLAVAGSTLAVAALFRPARGRIQALVDRRFYRRRYDTQRTLEAFSARLREEIDLGTLRRELLHVVDETMRPANLSLWLRSAGPRQ